MQDETIRPGILILVNDSDWDLLGNLNYKLQPNDSITFISTLHGGQSTHLFEHFLLLYSCQLAFVTPLFPTEFIETVGYPKMPGKVQKKYLVESKNYWKHFTDFESPFALFGRICNFLGIFRTFPSFFDGLRRQNWLLQRKLAIL